MARSRRDPDSPRVSVVMGSASDWPTMKCAVEMLERFEIPHEHAVVSAHRTPDRMRTFAQDAAERGVEVIIAGAGGAAHLPGMIASWTRLPVLGVPVKSRALSGVDSLLSIVQMPGGVPVATFSIGDAGAKNAGLFAARMLAVDDPELQKALDDFAEQQAKAALEAERE